MKEQARQKSAIKGVSGTCPFRIGEQPLLLVEVAACRGRCPPEDQYTLCQPLDQIELRNQKNRLEPWKLAENDNNSSLCCRKAMQKSSDNKFENKQANQPLMTNRSTHRRVFGGCSPVSRISAVRKPVQIPCKLCRDAKGWYCFTNDSDACSYTCFLFSLLQV